MFKITKIRTWSIVVFLFTGLLLSTAIISGSFAQENVKLVIDQKPINATPAPLIENGRTLVPVRLVSENMGAVVTWEPESRTVHIVKGNKTVLLRIDNRLVEIKDGGGSIFSLIDVPPRIIDDRTFVPLRLVSNALGVKVDWDDITRTIYVNSKQSVQFSPFFNVNLATVKPGQNITGVINLQISTNSELSAEAVEVRYQLLDPKTGKGPVVARGNNIKGVYQWVPDQNYDGQRVLTAALYDQKGNFLAGTAIPVLQAVKPQVALTGVSENQKVTENISIGTSLNFVAEYVKYELTNVSNGKVVVTDPMDPQGSYSWAPEVTDNGTTKIRVLAYNRQGQEYSSSVVTVNVDVEPKVNFQGVSPNATIEKPVNLWVWRNFPITQVEYILRDTRTGKEEVLAQRGYQGYYWFPGPELKGSFELFGKVKDTRGKEYTTEPVPVQLTGKAKLFVTGIGPKQIITDTVKLKSTTNIPLQAIDYKLFTPDNKFKKVIVQGNDGAAEYSWTPTEADAGSWLVQAVGITTSGEKIESEMIPVKVYMGKIYTAQPIIEKDKFLGFASELAVKAQKTTGMSAALQTAQAILETGWGQSTPVDKYTGQLSYNLFGIKGQGTAGSVISNTWEEYNGSIFRIDAEFRGYNKVEESWDDHKKLLLTASRYEPYRAVMHNSTLGAWALKSCGYATDSKYPLKLIDIIKRYDLQLLDEKGI